MKGEYVQYTKNYSSCVSHNGINTLLYLATDFNYDTM